MTRTRRGTDEMMTTEQHCATLDRLDPVAAIRAIHEALNQLTAIESGLENADNTAAIAALSECMGQAGHVGFTSENTK